MCDLGKVCEMSLKNGKEKESWCFLKGINQVTLICNQIVEEGMQVLERKCLYTFKICFGLFNVFSVQTLGKVTLTVWKLREEGFSHPLSRIVTGFPIR